jgi:hypothetical protein
MAQQSYRRLVNFEWEPIEGAKSYDLELKQQKENGKDYSFKVKDASWNGKLVPGKYKMRLRARDYRGVPGDWGDLSDFDVGLESATLVNPPPKAVVGAKDETETTVKFRWSPVGGAVAYQFELQTEDGEFKSATEVKGTEHSVEVPVARTFTWKVTGLGKEGLSSEASSMGDFTVMGPKLAPPKIEKPENEFVREIKWTRPTNVSKYDVAVTRLNKAKKSWEVVQVTKDVDVDHFNFDEKWPGGDYKIQVKAKGNLRVSSPVVSTNFKVRDGNRSPASEFTHEVRKSIDRINGWYGIASYLITMVNYSYQDYDVIEGGIATAYNAVGGTGRLGLGYFKEEKAWGFLGIMDMSGFTSNDNKNLTYSSMELNAVWRTPVGERGEFRSQMGMYYKEHQVARGNIITNTVDAYEVATVMGPHVSGEYWYSMTPKLGFQVNAHLYMSMMKMKTPNGQDIAPSMSTQFGFLGSYRFNKRFTGLVGYANREDRIRYKSTTAGATNEAVLSGDYLNFFAEYNF